MKNIINHCDSSSGCSRVVLTKWRVRNWFVIHKIFLLLAVIVLRFANNTYIQEVGKEEGGCVSKDTYPFLNVDGAR